jgi:hypothetical protein
MNLKDNHTERCTLHIFHVYLLLSRASSWKVAILNTQNRNGVCIGGIVKIFVGEVM